MMMFQLFSWMPFLYRVIAAAALVLFLFFVLVAIIRCIKDVILIWR